MNNKNSDNIISGGASLLVPAHLSMGQHILDRLKEICNKHNGVAMVNYQTGDKITFKELLQETVNFAVGLSNIGLKKGDVVGIYMENKYEYVTAVMSVIYCGAIVTTFNPNYTENEMKHVLNISFPKFIISSADNLKKHLKVLKCMPFVIKLIQLDGSPIEGDVYPYNTVKTTTNQDTFEPEEAHGDDTLFILYSSGTTGLPKGVMLTNLNVLYASASLSVGYTIESCTRFLSVLPMYHVFGLFTVIHYLTFNKLIVLMAYSPEQYLKAIQEYQINLLMVVPPIAVFLAKSEQIKKYNLTSVKSIWCGAAPLSADIEIGVLKNLPSCPKLIHGYGMTEATFAVLKSYDNLNRKEKHGSCGQVIPGIKVKVVDINSGRRLGPLKEGEICIKGPLVMKGYVNNDKANKNIKDNEDFLKTGDIGYYDYEGNFFIVDRLKELIKYKGNQVAPALVESVLLQHSGVLECGVVGKPDELAGELPTAFVVSKPGVTLTQRDLLDFTNERLSSTSHIRGGIYFVNEIPKSATGKILRRELKLKVKTLLSKL